MIAEATFASTAKRCLTERFCDRCKIVTVGGLNRKRVGHPWVSAWIIGFRVCRMSPGRDVGRLCFLRRACCVLCVFSAYVWTIADLATNPLIVEILVLWAEILRKLSWYGAT